jgi:small subunit ribosomal protein S11
MAEENEEKKAPARVDAADAISALTGEAPAETPVVGDAALKKARARGVKAVPVGIVHIRATFNNTQVSITDTRGAVISWSSAGRAGMSGSRKSTAFAATIVCQEAARQAVTRGMHEVEIRVQGAGAGRESAIRAIQAAGLNITVIKDVTPVPHNGCRPRKRRRV